MIHIQKVSFKSFTASALVIAFTLLAPGTARSAETTDIPPLTPTEKAKVQTLLKQLSTHLRSRSLDFEVGRDRISVGEFELFGKPNPDLAAAKSEYVQLVGMGKKILPELIVSLGNRAPSPYPTAIVESLIFDFEGQPMVIEFIANGKLTPPGFEAVENMLGYDDWRRTWLLPLFSSDVDAAREFAYTALPKKYRYCWEEWETHDKTQPMIDLHLKAATSDKSPKARKLAVAALGAIHEIIDNSEQDQGFGLRLSAYVDEVEGTKTQGETIGDAGKNVSAWREKRKATREEQKASIAHALCDMLEHDPDAAIRQECAKQLRYCKEPFVEASIIKGAKDTDEQVRDECAVFLMKQAWDASS